MFRCSLFSIATEKVGDEMPQAVKLILVCLFCIGLITAIVYLVKWLW